MEQLKSMKECLMSCAQSQMSNLSNVDAQELGAVIDMIKDLEEAIYYCTITKAMKESEKKEKYSNGNSNHYYYTQHIISILKNIEIWIWIMAECITAEVHLILVVQAMEIAALQEMVAVTGLILSEICLQ